MIRQDERLADDFQLPSATPDFVMPLINKLNPLPGPEVVGRAVHPCLVAHPHGSPLLLFSDLLYFARRAYGPLSGQQDLP